MSQRVPSATAVVLLISAVLACSVLRPKKPLTWHMTLELDYILPDRAAAVGQTIALLKKRLDAVGVYNFQIAPQGDSTNGRIDLKLPEVADRERLKQFLTAGGKLEITPVISPSNPSPIEVYSTMEEATTANTAKTGQVAPYKSGNEVGVMTHFLILEKTPIITGQDLRSANARPESSGGSNYAIGFTLQRAGAMRLSDWTRTHVNSYLAIVLNGTVVSAPYIRGEITDSGEINGRFSKREAEDLAQVLNSGALPGPLKIIEEGAIK